MGLLSKVGLGGLTSGNAIEALFDPAQLMGLSVETPPAAPLPSEPVTRLPTSTDAKKAKRLSILAQAKRRGRAATILTDSSSADSLGA